MIVGGIRLIFKLQPPPCFTAAKIRKAGQEILSCAVIQHWNKIIQDEEEQGERSKYYNNQRLE